MQHALTSTAIPASSDRTPPEVPPDGLEWIRVVAAWFVALTLTTGFAMLTGMMVVVAVGALMPGAVSVGPVALLVSVGAGCAARLFFRSARCTQRYLSGLTSRIRGTLLRRQQGALLPR